MLICLHDIFLSLKMSEINIVHCFVFFFSKLLQDLIVNTVPFNAMKNIAVQVCSNKGSSSSTVKGRSAKVDLYTNGHFKIFIALRVKEVPKLVSLHAL